MQVWFNKQVKWCSGAGAPVSLYCQGSWTPWRLSGTQARIVSDTLKVDISALINDISRDGERECGLQIEENGICAMDDIPFVGLERKQYSFKLRDAVAPEIRSFVPHNGDRQVALDATVTLEFNEPVQPGDDASLALTLSRLEVDNLGGASTIASRAFPLKSDLVVFKGSHLSVNLAGTLQVGRSYTLAVPPGAVQDSFGNEFAGLAAYKYAFTVSAGSLRGRSESSGTPSVAMAAFVVASVVLVSAGMALALVWFYKSGYCKRGIHRTSPEPSPGAYEKPTPAQFGGAAGTTSVHAQPRNSYRDSRYEADGSRFEAEQAWAHRTVGSARPQPSVVPGEAPPRSRSGPAPGAAGPRRASAPEAGAGRPRRPGDGGGPAPQAAPPPSAAAPEGCPQAKAVERQMRAAMEEPIAKRKKLFKDLLIQYHPDKNSQEHAKEVFQFVNNARSWFLLES